MKSKHIFFIVLVSTFFMNSLIIQAKGSFVGDTIDQLESKIDTLTQGDGAFNDLEDELNKLESGKSKDTTKIRIGKMKISIMEDGKDVEIDKGDWDDDKEEWSWSDEEFSLNSKKKSNRFEPHWASISIGWNHFMTASQSLTLPEDLRYLDLNTNKSLEVNLNITQLGINIIKNHVGLVTGVGLRWNNYKFSNTSVRLNKGVNQLEHYYDSSVNTVKSKLTVTYLTIPLLIEFQVPVNNRPLYLAAGVEGALKIEAHTKWKTDSGSKSKSRSDFYVNPFSYALTARVGYDSFGLYGTYSLQSLFKEDEGPELYPFAIGISFNF